MNFEPICNCHSICTCCAFVHIGTKGLTGAKRYELALLED